VAAVNFISLFFLTIPRTFRFLTFPLSVYIFKTLLENLKSFVLKEKEENIDYHGYARPKHQMNLILPISRTSHHGHLTSFDIRLLLWYKVSRGEFG